MNMTPDDESLFYNLDLGQGETMIVDVLKQAGIAPALIYAFKKTGRIVTEQNKHQLTDADLQEWKEAVDEYYSRVEQGDGPDI